MPRLHAKVPLLIALVVALLGAGWMAACGGDAESADDQESTRMIPPAEEQAESPAEDVDDVAPPADELAEAGDAANATGSAQEEAAPPAPVRTSPPRTADRNEPSRPGTSGNGTAPSAGEVPPVTERTDESSPAYEPPPAERAEPEPLAVPAGTRLALVMEQELTTREHRAGAAFSARLQEDVLGPRGEVLIDSGSRVHGRVLDSRRSEGPDRPAVLVLGVETLEAGGATRAIRGEVVELEHEAGVRDSNTETAAKVGAGAVAGAVLGKIIGGDRSDAVKGAVGGAAAGAAVAVGTRDGHAVVKEGARLVVRLDEPLVIAER